jgi:hypothetical protein
VFPGNNGTAVAPENPGCGGQKVLLLCKWQRKVCDTEIPRVQFQAFNYYYYYYYFD